MTSIVSSLPLLSGASLVAKRETATAREPDDPAALDASPAAAGVSLKESVAQVVAQRAAGADATEGEGDSERSAQDDFDPKMLDRIADRLISPNSRLSIDADEDLGSYVYRFVDKTDGEVLRQYPAEAILERMKALKEYHERVKIRDA